MARLCRAGRVQAWRLSGVQPPHLRRGSAAEPDPKRTCGEPLALRPARSFDRPLGIPNSILPPYALMKQGQQNDDRDWNAYQPEKDVAHVRLRLAGSHSAVFFPTDDSPPRPITELPALDRG